MEEVFKALNVALQHVLIAGHFFCIGEENAEHATHVVNDQRDARIFCRIQQALRQLIGQLGQSLVYARLCDFGQAGEAGGHGNRVA